MSPEEVQRLRALHKGGIAMMGGGARFEVALAGGVEEAEVLRLELYGRRDAGDGGDLRHPGGLRVSAGVIRELAKIGQQCMFRYFRIF